MTQPKWEYQLEFDDEPAAMVALLNNLGLAGWELVVLDRGRMIFKRRLEEE